MNIVILFNKIISIVIALMLLIFLDVNTSSAASKDFWFFDPPKEWPAQVMPGLRAGTEKPKTYIDNLIPFVGTKDIIVFADVKAVIGPEGSNEQNVGIGARDLLFDEKLILGGNFFYDTRYTENKARHHQLAFGLEGLTKWVDLRSNFYFPVSGRQKVNVAYDFRERSLAELDSYEEPLTGLDYEAGVLIPCLSDYCETRFFMGGYNYFPSVSRGLNGIKARVELRPVKGVTLNLELKNDNYSNANFYVEGIMSVPLDEVNLFKIKNPLTEFCRYFSYKKGIRPLRERMVDRIVRDIDVVAKPAPDVTESKAHELTYVDNSYTGGSSDGTLSHPYTTITDGVSNATGDKWVYVKKGSGNYIEAAHLELEDNVVLWGSGYNGGFNGISASGYPVIDGNTADVITLANNNTVMGLQIQNGSDGIYGLDITGADIKYNKILNNSNDGVNLLITSGSSNLTISNNEISSNTNYNIYVKTTASASATANILNNTITGSATGINLLSTSSSNITSTIAYNNISGATSYGMLLAGQAGSNSLNVTAYYNTINDCNYAVRGALLAVTRISMWRNIASDCTYGFHFGTNTSSNYIIDLGGGPLGSEGYNSCRNITTYNAATASGKTLYAMNNWWGAASPDTNKFLQISSIRYTPYLLSDPN